MSRTSEALAYCANPVCIQPKRHGGECDGDSPTYAQAVTRLAREYRSYGDASKLIPPADYAGIVNRLHAAADNVGINRADAAQDLFDEINAEPVA
jgi:hypothetical protein